MVMIWAIFGRFAGLKSFGILSKISKSIFFSKVIFSRICFMNSFVFRKSSKSMYSGFLKLSHNIMLGSFCHFWAHRKDGFY